MVNPSFTPDKPGTYTATLIVNNGSLDSAPSTVEISANVAPPIADAGAAQTVHPVATVTLDEASHLIRMVVVNDGFVDSTQGTVQITAVQTAQWSAPARR